MKNLGNNMKQVIFIVVSFLLITCLFIPSSCSLITGTEESNTFLDLLKLLPESAQAARCFSLIDYEKIWQDYGISLIASDGNKISQQELLNILESKIGEFIKHNDLGGLDVLTMGSLFTDSGIEILLNRVDPVQKEYVGFDLTNIKAEINIDNYPGKISSFHNDDIIGAIGQFDPIGTGNALKNQNDWPSWEVENYQTENYESIVINSWGDGTAVHPSDRYEPARLDLWGRAKPFAVSDKHLFVGRSVDDIKSMIDSSKNKAMSLADVPKYALAAKSIYELGVFGSTIADESYVSPPLDSNTSPLLRHFISFATGPGKDKKGNYCALVLVHSNNKLAQENVALLKQNISEFYGGKTAREIISDETITTDGVVLLAKFYTNSPNFNPVCFLTIGTILLAHE